MPASLSATPRAPISRSAISGASRWTASKPSRRRRRSRLTRPGAAASSFRRSPIATSAWSRARDEVDALMTLFSETIRREVDELARRGIELRFSGRLHDLSTALQDQIRQANERTRVSARAILNIAINYGGRQEIVDAIRELARDGADLTQLHEASVADHLYTRGLPDPDLVIRTAGEMRLSNFLLWQAAYSEFYCTQTLWPAFAQADFDEALASYQRRIRRFGARPEEVSNRGR